MPRRSPSSECHADALHRGVGAGAHRNSDPGLGAWASAGASLMLSPAIATTRPSRCRLRAPSARRRPPLVQQAPPSPSASASLEARLDDPDVPAVARCL